MLDLASLHPTRSLHTTRSPHTACSKQETGCALRWTTMLLRSLSFCRRPHVRRVYVSPLGFVLCPSSSPSRLHTGARPLVAAEPSHVRHVIRKRRGRLRRVGYVRRWRVLARIYCASASSLHSQVCFSLNPQAPCTSIISSSPSSVLPRSSTRTCAARTGRPRTTTATAAFPRLETLRLRIGPPPSTSRTATAARRAQRCRRNGGYRSTATRGGLQRIFVSVTMTFCFA